MKKLFRKANLCSYFLILIIIIFFLASNNSFAKTYVIKDEDGNIIKTTSIYQMSLAEKEAGYTISVLIEDRFPKEELNPPPGSKLTNVVLRVIDGDTIELLLIKSFKFVKIRLDGIDCPEKGQPYYEEATAYTSDLCLHKQVRVIKHDIDKYDRLIADVILPDGKNLSEELVRAGLAWWYYLYSDGLILKKLESNAKIARNGLWFQPNPMPPWEFRKLDSTGRLTENSSFNKTNLMKEDYDVDNLYYLEGAIIIANDNEYLGKIIKNKYNSDSINYKYGEYGSKYSSNSIFNKYGEYGSKYSSLSPFNKYTSTPPKIYKENEFIAYLSVNIFVSPRVDPNLLIAWLRE